MKTAKAIPTKAAIFSYFQGHHLALEVYDKASINESDVEKRLRAAGGAHQPSDMKFPGGGHPVKLGADLLSSGVSSSTSTPKPTAAANGNAAQVAAPSLMPKPTSFFVKSSAPVTAAVDTINVASTPVVAAVTAAAMTVASAAINAVIEKGKGLTASGEPVSAADVSALVAELEVIAKSLI